MLQYYELLKAKRMGMATWLTVCGLRCVNTLCVHECVLCAVYNSTVWPMHIVQHAYIAIELCKYCVDSANTNSMEKGALIRID